MTVSSVGIGQSTDLPSWRLPVRQAKQDFEQLFQALQTGNLNAAQQAYNSFQQLQTGLSSSSASSTGSTASTASTATNPVTTDWAALGQALQSGSLSSAQTALNQLQQDAQSAWQTHLQQETQNAQSVYALMQSVQGTTAGVSTTSSTASVQDDLNGLNQALQTGDTAMAQKLLAQLEQDLQSSGQTFPKHHHHHHGGTAAAIPITTSTSSTATTPVASASSATTGTTGTTSGSRTSA